MVQVGANNCQDYVVVVLVVGFVITQEFSLAVEGNSLRNMEVTSNHFGIRGWPFQFGEESLTNFVTLGHG